MNPNPMLAAAIDQTRGRLARDGWCILRAALPAETIAALDADLAPVFAETPFCEGSFYGETTKRFGRLLARSQHMAALVQHAVVQGVADLLGSAGLSADAQNGITISVEPKMGFIKGSVGSDFVVPCVDYIITATLPGGQPQQVAAADCQRMVWQNDSNGGRWVIGPGKEPAQAASVWPGSQASVDAGYQWLEVPQS